MGVVGSELDGYCGGWGGRLYEVSLMGGGCVK